MNSIFLIVLFTQECLTSIKEWSLTYNKSSSKTFKKTIVRCSQDREQSEYIYIGNTLYV